MVKGSKLVTNIHSNPNFKKCFQSSGNSDIPSVWLKGSDSSWNASLGIPRIIVVNAQLPYSSPSLWAPQTAESDPGFSVIGYFALNPAIAAACAAGKAPAAVNLLKRIISEGKSSKDGVPLKAIGIVENCDELGLPDVIRGYNGKPVLITKSCKVFTNISESNELLEVEFDVRQWSFIARKSLNSLHSVNYLIFLYLFLIYLFN